MLHLLENKTRTSENYRVTHLILKPWFTRNKSQTPYKDFQNYSITMIEYSDLSTVRLKNIIRVKSNLTWNDLKSNPKSHSRSTSIETKNSIKNDRFWPENKLHASSSKCRFDLFFPKLYLKIIEIFTKIQNRLFSCLKICFQSKFTFFAYFFIIKSLPWLIC